MNIRNIAALYAMLVVGYVTYTMEPVGGGESSAMAAARGAGRQIPRLEEIAAEAVARQIHDQKKTSFTDVPFMEKGETRLDEFPELMQELVAEAYYRLYPEEICTRVVAAPERVQEIPASLGGLAALPDGGFVGFFTEWETLHESIEYWRMGADNQFHRSQIVTRQNMNNRLIGSIAVSPDGNLLAAQMRSGVFVYERGDDGQFTLLQEVPIQVEDTDRFIQLAVHHSEASKTLVVAYVKPGHQRVFDIFAWDNRRNSFFREQEITHNEEWINEINFDGTGNYFACASSTKVEIWSKNSSAGLWSSKEVLILSGAPFWANSVAFSPDNRFILTSQPASFTLWRMSQQGTITLVQDIDVPGNYYRICNFSRDSSRFALISYNGWRATIWNLNRTNNEVKRIYSLGESRCLTALFIGDEYLALGAGRTIEIWHVPQPTVEQIWNYILTYSDMPELEEPQPIAESSTSSSPSSVATNEPVVLSPAQELQAIVEQKKAIKANRSLTPAQKEEQLNALRARERQLKAQCEQQGTSCTLQ